jgi:hypothetical protein
VGSQGDYCDGDGAGKIRETFNIFIHIFWELLDITTYLDPEEPGGDCITRRVRSCRRSYAHARMITSSIIRWERLAAWERGGIHASWLEWRKKTEA